MPRAGPRKVQQYSLESNSRRSSSVSWRASKSRWWPTPSKSTRSCCHVGGKIARDGCASRAVSVPAAVKKTPADREMRRFQALQRAHAPLEEEHALLIKLIRFTSARRPTSSRSSTKSAKCLAWRSGRRVRARDRTGYFSKKCVRSSSAVVGPRESASPSGADGAWLPAQSRRLERLMRPGGWRARVVWSPSSTR